jgi:hypothetical protein
MHVAGNIYTFLQGAYLCTKRHIQHQLLALSVINGKLQNGGIPLQHKCIVKLHDTQPNKMHSYYSHILYYNIFSPIQHVLIPHGIIIRDSYKCKIAWTELTIYAYVKKILLLYESLMMITRGIKTCWIGLKILQYRISE